MPMAAGCYFALGDRVLDNIVNSMSDGWERITVEIMLLLHLITAYPIITNPPAQFFEEVLNIPSSECTFIKELYKMMILNEQVLTGKEWL